MVILLSELSKNETNLNPSHSIRKYLARRQCHQRK